MPSIPIQMTAIEITKPGGPEVLRPVQRPVPRPSNGEVLIRVDAAGVNRPDVLQRRLHAAHPNRVAVVNAGIGGNQVAGPAQYAPERPFPGGPRALDRLERDVIHLSGVSAMVWL